MNLIVIWKVRLNRDKRFRSKLLYAVLEEWIFGNVHVPLYDVEIYRNDSYWWSKEVLKIWSTGLRFKESLPTVRGLISENLE